ncbi:vesicular glutamate transporter 1-like [Nilaparvata lugens]|uniref:vesicular glutamate transporter 1-like n=1 Tax=Nilaparvata lugens TaxID=108931 RepID=UPI00193D9818|nr:vesicular glutamate transporter 1-like [Nilaparvata lugens]XP_039284456.1 vesicular glutamate transporter 1-like [Nilaparvata lugens]
MLGFPALTILKDKAQSLFGRNIEYEEFELPNKDLQHQESVGKGYYGGADEMGGGRGAGTPDSLPEPERPPLRHIDKYIKPELPCLTKRYTVALLTCVGFIISFGMRCNMGMAKLRFERRPDQVTSSNSSETTTHAPSGDDDDDDDVRFNWSVAVESAVDSSFFWGYLLTQVPGGFLASKYPANRIFGTAIAISSFLNLLVPAATSVPEFLIIIRVMQGLVEGVTYPACHGIWRFWAPPLERSRLATIAFCGSYAGVVFGMPLSGILTGSISWRAPFYFYGVVGILWYLSWLWLTFEKPAKHPTISARELQYIEASLGTSTQQAMPTMATTPWRAFSTSMPVYAIIVANFCRSWNFYLLVLFQASYLRDVFHLQIAETGFVGALPHLLMTVIVPLGGMLADHVRKRGILTTTNVRKLFNCGGFGMEAVFFLVVAHAHSAVTANLALTCGVAFSGFAISGFNVNHLDIAPRYASILMGMSNGVGTIAGLFLPIAIDNITKDHSPESWKFVFIMAATVHFFGVSFYAMFASGELQPWAETIVGEEKSATPAPGPPQGGPPPRPPHPPQPTWDPMEDATKPTMDGQNQMINYGSMGQQGGQYGYTNHVMTEQVQPESRDTYMHGGGY